MTRLRGVARGLLLALGAVLLGGTEAGAWRVSLDEGILVDTFDRTNAAVADAAGDVYAAALFGGNFAVFKQSGATGGELWRYRLDGIGEASAIALDAAGDVVVGGGVEKSGVNADFFVAKLAGATGAEIWSRRIEGPGFTTGNVTDLAVDAAGDVIAAGWLWNAQTARDFTVVKLSGATGAELWRRTLDGTAPETTQTVSREIALALVVDGAGDVIAAGALENAGTTADLAAVKFAGADGTELWRWVVDGAAPEPECNGVEDVAQAIALAPGGDVVVGGHICETPSPAGTDLLLARLDGATGAETWRTVLDGTASIDSDRADAVAIDAAGDVVVAGNLDDRPLAQWRVLKVAGATGAVLWKSALGGSTFGFGSEVVAIDAAGDVLASNALAFTLWKLDGDTGGTLWMYDGAPGLIAIPAAIALAPGGDAVLAPPPPPTGRDFAVVKFGGQSGQERWRTVVDGSAGGFDEAHAVAVDGSGNVVAAGLLDDPIGGANFAVLKLAGATGAVRWQQNIEGDNIGFDEALAVTVDAAGDVLAAGYVHNFFTLADFVVAKLAGASGQVRWTAQLTGTAGDLDEARAVAVDAAGDVVAAGVLANAGSGEDFVVAKLAGATGGLAWTYERAGSAGEDDAATAVAVDPAGDVVAGGVVRNAGEDADFAVVKLAGATGAELWRADVRGGAASRDELRALVVDGAGDVYATGAVTNAATSQDLVVVKLAGATGTELWRYERDGGAAGLDAGWALVLGPSGDVLVTGEVAGPGTGGDLVLLRLDAATGAERWRRELDGTRHGSDRGRAITVDPLGRVASAGVFANVDRGRDFAVATVQAADGSDVDPLGCPAGGCPLAGRTLKLQDPFGAPERRKLVAVARDVALQAPAPNSDGDPRAGGGLLEVQNPTTGETFQMPLPASGWVAAGNPPGARGYRFKDRAGTCRAVVLKPGRVLRAVCKGAGITFTLDEPAQNTLDVRLTLGAGAAPWRSCMRFGGTVVRDRPATAAQSGQFRAKNAPAPLACE